MPGLHSWKCIFTHTLCKEGGFPLKFRGLEHFSKYHVLEHPPLHVRGIPCWVTQHKPNLGNTERGGKGTPNPKFLGPGGSSVLIPGRSRRFTAR